MKKSVTSYFCIKDYLTKKRKQLLAGPLWQACWSQQFCYELEVSVWELYFEENTEKVLSQPSPNYIYLKMHELWL